MATTVHRNTSKSGLVLLQSSIDVAEDGFVRVVAQFLGPHDNSLSSEFLLDQPWPLPTLPAGTPSLQSKPVLTTSQVQKRSGLIYIDAVYVSALNPPRISISKSQSLARFSGFEPPVQSGFTFVEGYALLAFDYLAESVTSSYALVGQNQYEPKTQDGLVSDKFNVVRSGKSERVTTAVVQLITRQTEKIGLVSRISVTATPKIVQTGEFAETLQKIELARSVNR